MNIEWTNYSAETIIQLLLRFRATLAAACLRPEAVIAPCIDDDSRKHYVTWCLFGRDVTYDVITRHQAKAAGTERKKHLCRVLGGINGS